MRAGNTLMEIIMALDLSTVDWEQYTTADLIQNFAHVKNALDAKAAKFKQDIEILGEGAKAIQEELLKRMNHDGTDNVTAKGFGTAYIKKVQHVNVSDWGEFYEHLDQRIKQGDDPTSVFSAFQRKVTKEYVVAWAATHKETLPKGVNLNTERTLVVRRDTSSKEQ